MELGTGILFTFKNTHVVMMAEKVLLRSGISVSVLPLPAQISAGCGLCLLVLPDETKKSMQALAENHIIDFEMYTKAMENGRIVYKQNTDC
jgi:Fe-S oxidoreductase